MAENGLKNWKIMLQKTTNKALLLIAFVFSFHFSQAQYFDLGFERNDSIQVLKPDGSSYSDPWAGGLNSCQFFELDLDLNGTNDLIVFDKHGNKCLPFLRFNDCGHTGYYFAPQYVDLLPKFVSWVNSFDYDLDGNKDVLTYTLGGVKVYKNTSDLIFQLREVKPRLTSDYGSGTPINLYTSEADYPGFADVNGDEAMDVVNFWALGKFVEYHQNTGLSLFGSFDSLNYRLNSSCWGHFEENESSNVLVLNSDCGSKDVVDNTRHSGSTMLLLDLNGDGIKDIVIGDVDYPQLISLLNSGSADTARMLSQDTMFPTPAKPVRLYSMPAATTLDVDFDDIPDLLVSPFDPSPAKSENQHSIWLYKNIGTREVPQYSFVTSNFLQDRMIDLGSGAYPSIGDVNGDGLLDIVVGNWGVYDSSNYIGSFLHSYYSSSLSLFLNIGTFQEPKFKQVDTNFGNLHSISRKGYSPALGDIDGDGDIDLLVGDETGKITLLTNTAGPNQLPQFAAPILNYQNISVYSYSAPQLFDLNKDNKLDLLIGDSLGRIHYYQNTGTVSTPVFTLVTDTLGGVNVRNANVSYYGFSTPCFFSKNDTTFLAVGSQSGFIYTYKNIDHNLSGQFALIEDSSFFVRNQSRVPIYEGIRSAVAIADLNGDQFPDMILGNYSGGCTFYKGITPPPLEISIKEQSDIPADFSIKIFPNPCTEQITIKAIQNEVPLESESAIIYNILMQEVQVVPGIVNIVNVSDLKPGIYFLRIQTKKGDLHVAKFVKK
jgi:hypothetical protein